MTDGERRHMEKLYFEIPAASRKEDAMECYARLFDYYTASVYVAQARKSYRRLRDELKK